MNINTIQHHSYEKGLPQEGNFILGQKHGDNIFVYQAFNDKIADYAIENQKFGGQEYSFDRMTWIKPNFLWMMCRSDWANKDSNQSRILAIEMTFEFISFLPNDKVVRWTDVPKEESKYVPIYIKPLQYKVLEGKDLLDGDGLIELYYLNKEGQPKSKLVKYITTIRQNYAQRIANHAFSYPLRVGVDFVKI